MGGGGGELNWLDGVELEMFHHAKVLSNYSDYSRVQYFYNQGDKL